MEEKNLICINSPMGCMLNVAMEEGEILGVSGNTCRRGEAYARKELTNPTRIVTTTVKVSGGAARMVPVKTREDIPKRKVLECVRALKDVEAKAPIRIGDVIVENIVGTGVDIVAAKAVAQEIWQPDEKGHKTLLKDR